MPGPITHQIFYTQLKERLSGSVLSAMPNYDSYSVFAQGHDLLIYKDFYKIFSQKRLAENIRQSERMQEYSFQEFIYAYLKTARNLGVLEREQVRAFLGPGYIAHHILDAYTHPFIIYQAGDHVRDPKRPTWKHGIVENYIDLFMLARESDFGFKKKKLVLPFTFSEKKLDCQLPVVLNICMEEIYGFQDGGTAMCRALSQIALFIRLFKYDPSGLKRIFFDLADPFLKGTASFSYHRNTDKAREFLNEGHEIWCNPMDESLCSKESFFDLYNRALADSARIIEKLEELCRSRKITKRAVFEIVPDIASTHGLRCGRKIEIRYTKERREGIQS